MTQSNASADAGSAENTVFDPNFSGGIGESNSQSQTNENKEDYVPKEMYEALESKLGEQGQELGELREFFDQTSPLLERLDKDPELVEAILQDKISSSLFKDVLAGNVPTVVAETVTKAQEDVKKDLGEKKFEEADPQLIDRLIEEKLQGKFAKLENKFSNEISEVEKMRTFKEKMNAFTSSKPDFAEYALEIDRYIEEHPTVDDISVAYDAVKGIALQKEKENDEERRKAEEQKKLASNVAGGQSSSTVNISSEEVLDKFFSSRRNPNAF